MSAAVSVVSWKWRPPATGYRSMFSAEHVNTLRRMVLRHYARPHRFICCTDDPAGLDPEIEVVPLWPDFADVANPHGRKFPSCYRRLRAFDPDIGAVFGKRFVSLDLDTVITADVTPLWDRPEDFVIWGNTHATTPYNGSMFLLTAGARPQVWTDFDPVQSPIDATRAGFFGSDQGWIAYKLGPHEHRWTRTDGVYSFRLHLRNTQQIPGHVRLVCFHGGIDPWSSRAQAFKWVRENWR